MTVTESGAALLNYLTTPPRSPILQMSTYFAVLIGLGALGVTYVPVVADALMAPVPTGAAGTPDLRDLLAQASQPAVGHLIFDLRMGIVMLGTMLITIPFSWGYMAIRERSGFEQSVVQTLVVLPIVVAAIMMIVQNSLALAFALGGVAAAVRFRNTLKDVADATYVFLAIGIGIAAGTGALTAALVMSAVFTYVSVLLWRCNFGECQTEAAAVSAPDAASAEEGKPVRGELTIELPESARQGPVERVLAKSAKRWKLRRSSQTDSGATRLVYDVRLRRSTTIPALTGRLRAELEGTGGVVRFSARVARAEEHVA